MATIRKFEELDIGKEARSLSFKVYEITRDGHFSKDFRFRGRICAAAGSVMDNIAEGFERSSRLEFINFLSISKGSCGEVKSQSFRTLDQKYISQIEFDELYRRYDKLSADIAGFIRYLNKANIKGQKFKDRI